MLMRMNYARSRNLQSKGANWTATDGRFEGGGAVWADGLAVVVGSLDLLVIARMMPRQSQSLLLMQLRAAPGL